MQASALLMAWRVLGLLLICSSLGERNQTPNLQDIPHLQLVQRQLILLKSTPKNRTWDEAKQKAAEVVAQLTVPELNDLLRGSHFAMSGSPDVGYYVGNIASIPRLQIPALKMQDAAQGFRPTEPNTGGTTTAYPCMLALASTWDEDLVNLVAAAIGTEFKGKGANVILGPSVNVHRVAAGGRNFEYLSGEDPHLGFRLTAAYVKGVQEQGVMAVAKHFAFNEQETHRMTMDAKASERTAMELYFAPFRGAVSAGVGSFMCAYNKVNGTYSCQNAELLKKDLRGLMDFQGFVMSDWLATHTPDALAAGMDQEQPGIIQLPLGAKSAVLTDKELNKVDKHIREAAASHVLTAVYRMGLDREPGCTPPNCTQELVSDQTKATTRGQRHEEIAFHAAASSVVLMKNNGLLPLTKDKVRRIAVLGEAAVDETHRTYVGKGSGYVQPDSSAKTPLAAIEERAAKENIEIIRPDSHTPEEAKSLGGTVDAIIVVVGVDASEGSDRTSLDLGHKSDHLVKAAASKAPTIVLLQIPGAVLMPWKGEVGAIAGIFMGGVATGAAWASVLFGDKLPTGRLPLMMPETINDTIQIGENREVDYSEGLLTSYRSPSFKAAFPFGHGLTYTTFEFSGAQQTREGCQAAACVEVTVTNSGKTAGEEVVQAYLHFPEPSGGDEKWVKSTPAKVLKGFHRTQELKPGQTETVLFNFAPEDFTLFSSERGWVEQSKVTVHLGASSEDIRQSLPVEPLS
ncbi:unnamed protein product [Durusdinium trenchii]|uniref:Probable beta-glucosidase G n=1 Tax=Durusdinium trenchii TaxID=1381693 RepID=A0ABP0KQN2_9DINO